MARPAKWASPTTAIRVPERIAEELLEIAKMMDQDSQGFVQNSESAVNDLFAEIDRLGWHWSAHKSSNGFWFTIVTGDIGTANGHYFARNQPTLRDALSKAFKLASDSELNRVGQELIIKEVSPGA